jgi:hypothetical protein
VQHAPWSAEHAFGAQGMCTFPTPPSPRTTSLYMVILPAIALWSGCAGERSQCVVRGVLLQRVSERSKNILRCGCVGGGPRGRVRLLCLVLPPELQ